MQETYILHGAIKGAVTGAIGGALPGGIGSAVSFAVGMAMDGVKAAVEGQSAGEFFKATGIGVVSAGAGAVGGIVSKKVGEAVASKVASLLRMPTGIMEQFIQLTGAVSMVVGESTSKTATSSGLQGRRMTRDEWEMGLLNTAIDYAFQGIGAGVQMGVASQQKSQTKENETRYSEGGTSSNAKGLTNERKAEIIAKSQAQMSERYGKYVPEGMWGYRRLGFLPREEFMALHGDQGGAFSPATGAIDINESALNPVTVVNHEISHANNIGFKVTTPLEEGATQLLAMEAANDPGVVCPYSSEVEMVREVLVIAGGDVESLASQYFGGTNAVSGQFSQATWQEFQNQAWGVYSSNSTIKDYSSALNYLKKNK